MNLRAADKSTPEISDPPINILHLEDSLLDAELARHKLSAAGLQFQIHRVETGADFQACLSRSAYDLILSDYNLPSFDGLTALELAQRVCPATPFIFCTGALGEEVAIDMIRRGATDYVLKQRLERLVPAIQRAIRESRERQARHQAENALRRSERQYRAAIDGVLDYAIIAVDNDRRIATWNRGAERMHDRLAADAIGQKIDIIYCAPDAANGLPALHLQAALQAGESTVNHACMRRDGSSFPARIVITASRSSNDERHGWLVVIYDATEQTRAAAEREALLEREKTARAEAESASRIKDEFLAVASHELRTPLNAILGWSSLLKPSSGPREIEEGVEVIRRNARHQAQLIEDILDMSRMIAGRLRLNPAPLNLAPIIERSLETVRTAADAKGVTFSLRLGEIGPVHCDAGRFEQIVWNLVSNAIKFTPRGGEVIVALDAVESRARLSIVDTGVGIEPEFLPFVFDRFQQADSSTTRRHGGLGLGLAIVRHLVELHGGSVEAFSAGYGRGSTFVVNLPLVAVTMPSADYSDRPAPVDSADGDFDCPPRLAGQKVLVVDDDVDARRILQAILESCGAQVVCASSVADAMRRISQDDSLELILSDIGMPAEDGYAFIRQLREDEQARNLSRRFALALTAYTRPSDRVAALSAGYDAYMPKPIEARELLAILAGQLR